MNKLEHKIPPPIVMLFCAALMWLTSKFGSLFFIPSFIKIALILMLLICALVFLFGGLLYFRNAETTINPLKPQEASSLVTNGVYQITRNPMYLGLTLILLSWAFILSSILAFCFVPVFIIYIHYLQILPEENALKTLFGDEFLQYKSTVRRWI